MKILNSKTTVDNYPYGRLKAKATFDLEFNPKKGFRSVFQTVNPKTGRINNPKKGTYQTMMVMYMDENDHVKYKSFGGIGGLENYYKLFKELEEMGYKPSKEIEEYLILEAVGYYKIEVRAKLGYKFNTFNMSNETPERKKDLEIIHDNTKLAIDYMMLEMKYKEALKVYGEKKSLKELTKVLSQANFNFTEKDIVNYIEKNKGKKEVVKKEEIKKEVNSISGLTYEQWKASVVVMDRRLEALQNVFNSYPKGNDGRTTDAVTKSAEYKKTDKEFKKVFKDLQNSNKTHKEYVKKQAIEKREIMKNKKTPAKAPAKAPASKPASRKRTTPTKAPVKTEVKATKGKRMSTAQKLSSGSEALKLAGCLELASTCMRKGRPDKESKSILNKSYKVKEVLTKGSADSKEIKAFMSKVRANDQRLYKALKSCTRNTEVEKFYNDIVSTFKGESKAKGLPESI